MIFLFFYHSWLEITPLYLCLSVSVSIKVVIPHKSRFHLLFRDLVIALVRMWLSLSWCACGCHCLGAACGCVVSIRHFGFRCRGMTYICVGAIQTSKSISDRRKEIKSMVINMLQNWSHWYSSHNSNIKCIGSTIKCVGLN